MPWTLGIALLAGHFLVDPPAPSCAPELGLTAETLAAAGVNGGQASDIVNGLSNTEGYGAFLAARIALDVAVNAASTAAAPLDVWSTEEQIQSNAIAQAALDTAQTAYETARSALRSAALGNLAPNVIVLIETQIGNAGRHAAPAHRVLSLADSAWHDLELALIAQARASRTDANLPAEQVALLQDVASNLSVTTAQANLDVFGAAVEAAVEQPQAE